MITKYNDDSVKVSRTKSLFLTICLNLEKKVLGGASSAIDCALPKGPSIESRLYNLYIVF